MVDNYFDFVQIVDQVLSGDGVGWLKLSRLKKLMEDENYRVIILNKLVSSLEPKVAPDDHIQDVVRAAVPVHFVVPLLIMTSQFSVHHQASVQRDPKSATNHSDWSGDQCL